MRPTCRLAAQAALLLRPVFSCPHTAVQLSLSLFVISLSDALRPSFCLARPLLCALRFARAHVAEIRCRSCLHSAVATVFCPLRLCLDADPRSLDVCSRLLLRAVAVDCLPAALLLRRTQLIAAYLLSFLLLSASTALPRRAVAPFAVFRRRCRRLCATTRSAAALFPCRLLQPVLDCHSFLPTLLLADSADHATTCCSHSLRRGLGDLHLACCLCVQLIVDVRLAATSA
jgi:hypothetical protein